MTGLNGDTLLGVDLNFGPADPATVLASVNSFLGSGLSLSSAFGGTGRFDAENTPVDDCKLGCSIAVDAAFSLFVIKYGTVHALFSNGGNLSLAEYSLGANNFGTSNLTAIVPVPAALPLMLGALAGLGLIARRRADT